MLCGLLVMLLIFTNLREVWLRMCLAFAKPFFVMSKRKKFREQAALHILTVLIDKTTNPAKTAVFWANELVKELYDEKRSNNRH